MSFESIWLGFDPREASAFAVAKHSICRRLTAPIPVRGLVLADLQWDGLYHRTISRQPNGQLWDPISDAPMSTEFAISRFLTPIMARRGWALFMDSDILVRTNLVRLFELADPSKAVMCVQHRHEPPEGVKMDGQAQTRYRRKNWSSVMLFNCEHPANKGLTLELINSAPGRDLHAFCWLKDEEIGALPPEWNWLVGHSDGALDPMIVHFTDGFPQMPGYDRQPYADEWRRELGLWAGGR